MTDIGRVIETRALTKRYHDAVAVDALGLIVRRGEVPGDGPAGGSVWCAVTIGASAQASST